MQIKIKASNLTKKFSSITVFKDLEFSISESKPFAVTGKNGSGKSTLLEIIAGIRKPTSGLIKFVNNSIDCDPKIFSERMGFSSPKINPYAELTAFENIHFAYRDGGEKNIRDIAGSMLDKFGLYKDMDKEVRFFSSGMKQRLRLILALLNDPYILILDEPGSNLDSEGEKAVYSYIESFSSGRIIVIATNQEREAALCTERIHLEKHS